MSDAVRTVLWVWGSLLCLLAATLLAAALALGAWAGLVIAAAKAALVAWFFMHLSRSTRAARLAATAGFVMLACLAALVLLDYGTRA